MGLALQNTPTRMSDMKVGDVACVVQGRKYIMKTGINSEVWHASWSFIDLRTGVEYGQENDLEVEILPNGFTFTTT